MFFVLNKEKNVAEDRETYSCFISVPIEIHRLAPLSVNLSLHISFLSPEMCAEKNSIPAGIGIFSPSNYCSSGPVSCGGILELFKTVLTLEEVEQIYLNRVFTNYKISFMRH